MVLPASKAASGKARASWGEFVALPENRSALQAVRRLARVLTKAAGSPGPLPLVLHGPSGTGKTLLVRTLIQKVTQQPSGLTANVIPAVELPRFADDSKAKEHPLEDLKRCDLLAIEDLQHLPEKLAGVFCRLLDHRMSRRQPTLITATVGPAGLKHLPRRLTSRLAAGLVIQLEPLTETGRRRLLEWFTHKIHLQLTDDALDWLAAHATGGGVRPLFGQVERLRTLARGVLGSLDVDTVQELLAEKQPASRTSPIQKIMKRVAVTFGVGVKEITGPCRQRTVMLARQVAMYLARELIKLSYPAIGKAFGNRNHATVMHACSKLAETLKKDTKLRRTVRELKAELG